MLFEDSSGDENHPTVTRRSALGATAGGLLAPSLSATTVTAQETDRIRWRKEFRYSLPWSLKVEAGTALVINPEKESLIIACNVDDGDERWRTEAIGGVDDGFFIDLLHDPFRQPPVSDGKVFILANYESEYESGVTVSESIEIKAVSILTGKALWTYEWNDDLALPLTVSNGTVFAAGPGFGATTPGSICRALNADTGDEKWTVDLSPFTPKMQPSVADRTVLIQGQEEEARRNFIDKSDYYVYALDAETGTQQWTYKIAPEDNETGFLPSVVANQTVLVKGRLENEGGDTLHAVDIETGERQWYHTSVRRIGSLSVVDETVLLSNDLGYTALDIKTGETQWANTRSSDFRSGAMISNGKAIYEKPNGNLFAVDVDTGLQEWAVEMDPVEVGYQPNKPLVMNEEVLVGRNNRLYAVNVDTGTVEWEFELEFEGDTERITDITASNGTGFVTTGEGLYAVDLDLSDNGSEASETDTDESLLQQIIDAITGG